MNVDGKRAMVPLNDPSHEKWNDLKVFGRPPCDFVVTWMFMRDVGEEMCWRQLLDVGDGLTVKL